MRVWVTAGTTALFLVILLASCREPTELTLDLTTDLSCSGSDPLGETSIYVGTAEALARPIGELTPAAVTQGCMGGREGRIGSIVILPSGSDDDRISIRVVAGRKSASCAANLQSGCIEARRSLGFVPHTSLFLPVVLTKSCENVVCDNATDTCADGRCVSGVTDCSAGRCTPPSPDAGSFDAPALVDVIILKDTSVPETGVIKDSGLVESGTVDSGTDSSTVDSGTDSGGSDSGVKDTGSG